VDAIDTNSQIQESLRLVFKKPLAKSAYSSEIGHVSGAKQAIRPAKSATL
jgi:hypothetical protein